MDVTREDALRGRVTVRPGELARIRAVQAYNKRVWGLRRAAKLTRELRFGVALLNPLYTLGLGFACRKTVFARPAPAAVLLLLVAAAYVIALARAAEPVLAAASAALILLDWRFAFLCAANAVLAVLLVKTERPLKKEIGYPLFQEIELIFDDD